MKSVGKGRVFLLGVLLTVVTAALYWPITGYDFIGLDDDQYVYENPWVRSGLGWPTIKWAFTSTFAANWHPLTWISHLLDYSIYGLSADGPHFTNLILHALNVILLFAVLVRLTGLTWPSVMVAALFAWHPLHVESVAWISERKDLLSTLWWILSIWAYARATKDLKGSIWSTKSAANKVFYGLSISLFALGLMSKPMVVTLPFVLLLLDYWPLNRWQDTTEGTASPKCLRIESSLVIEKLPFFILSLAGSVVTVVAQHAGEAIKTFHQVPLILRVVNLPVAYAFYIEKTFWPDNLCGFYPLPATPLFLDGIATGLVLVGASVSFVRLRRQYPWLIVGWLWFLGTLIPVIGLVQVGGQAMADRYMYIPSIGLFIMIAWGINRCLNIWPQTRMVGCTVIAATLVCCALKTQWQMAYWRNSLVFYSRILEISKNSDMAQNGIGVALSSAGRKEEAIEHFKEALRLNPASVHAFYNLGIDLADTGRLDEAMVQFSAALKLNPRNEQLHNNAGVILVQQGKLEQALDQFNESIRLNPIYPKPYLNSARIYESRGAFGNAVTNYSKALQLEPDSSETLDRLALLLATCRDSRWRNPAGAVQLAQRATELTRSKEPNYLATLATSYASAGQYSNAAIAAELARQCAAANKLEALAAKIDKDLLFFKAGHAAPERTNK